MAELEYPKTTVTESRNIEDYRQRHAGKRVVLLGNGPTLRNWSQEEVDDMEGWVIGINRSWARSRDGSFKGFKGTDYHCFLSGPHAQDLADGCVSTRLAIFPRSLEFIVNCAESRFKDFITINQMASGYMPGAFEFDMSRGVSTKFAGYFAMQIAAWMGFSEWILLGFDAHDREGHAHDENPAKGLITRQGMREWNHGVKAWADNRKGAQAVTILNANPDSAIEEFEKVSKEALFERLGV